MARIDAIPLERMTAAQRRFHDSLVAKGRRTETGPWTVLLRAPEVGECLVRIVEYFNSNTLLPHKLKSLAVLIIARAYTSQFEWCIHERRARAAGLGGELIDAIRIRARPVFGDPNEELVYDMTCEILDKRALGNDLHARAVGALGQAAVVELVADIGFYIAVAILLVSYDVEAPEGAAPPLAR